MTSSIIAIRYCKEKNERYRRKVALANKESASYAKRRGCSCLKFLIKWKGRLKDRGFLSSREMDF